VRETRNRKGENLTLHRGCRSQRLVGGASRGLRSRDRGAVTGTGQSPPSHMTRLKVHSFREEGNRGAPINSLRNDRRRC